MPCVTYVVSIYTELYTRDRIYFIISRRDLTSSMNHDDASHNEPAAEHCQCRQDNNPMAQLLVNEVAVRISTVDDSRFQTVR